jgi:hypothetical protein
MLMQVVLQPTIYFELNPSSPQVILFAFWSIFSYVKNFPLPLGGFFEKTKFTKID